MQDLEYAGARPRQPRRRRPAGALRMPATPTSITQPPVYAAEPAQGLDEAEAAARLARDGPNRIERGRRRNVAAIALGIVVQPMFLLLLATALVYAVLGDAGDAAALLVSVVVVGFISLVQEYRAERALEALKELSSPRTRVVRGGRVLRIASQELVVGDRVLIGEGDRLACDASLVRAHGLLVDESLLTGESAPVFKSAGTPESADASHLVRAGTLVVQGDGVGIVCATGARTALGQIGGTLAAIAPRPSRLQAELKAIVRRVAVFAVLVSVAAAFLYAARQGSLAEGLLAGLTLAMAIVPEEFAVVWTVMLALGAWRLARRKVLTRQAQAIEALGTTTVLAVDKTGTLTHNRMELLALQTADVMVHLAPGAAADRRFAPLLQAAALASAEDGIEPMDRALLRLHERSFGAWAAAGTLVRREGVAAERPYFSNWWAHGDGSGGVHAVKGAPEAVVALCAIDAQRAAQIRADAERMAQQGLRVLGVARHDWGGAAPPPPHERRLTWLGLLGFLDPVRDEVPAALAQCRSAGMRVVMITGDAPATAAAIARMAGLDREAASGSVVTGTQLAALDDDALDTLVGRTTIYARVSPAQKLRIVRALQRRGDVVAMTGDGVNDASALRAADIGVAMGARGTDVAREAAALVLLDDSFGSLVDAVRTGRRIFDNLRNAVGYLVAVHVPIVGASLLPLVVGGPALLLPLHIVLLELIIDPACSLVFEAEPESRDCMTRPPRAHDVGLMSRDAIVRALGAGLLALFGVLLVLAATRLADLDATAARPAVLAALIVGNLAMLRWYLHGRRAAAPRRNRAFGWLLVGVAALSAVILSFARWLPQLGFGDTRSFDIAAAALAAAAVWAFLRVRRSPPATDAAS